MEQIDIANAILENRKKKKITQEELAAFMGVSKAAVSKWETGQSYPDITLLPQLATYFGVSMDELMRYTPQMSKDEIRKTYVKLRELFGKESFETAYQEWEKIVKKYYSCLPLLYQMGILLVNYSVSTEEEGKKNQILFEAEALFHKVETESKEAELIKFAIQGKAMCGLLRAEPEKIIYNLKDKSKIFISNEILLAQAYAMTGEIAQAKSEIQISLFQHVFAMMTNLQYMMFLYMEEEIRFRETVNRAVGVLQLFEVENMNSWVVLPIYLCAARGFVRHNQLEEALEQLERYAEVVTEKTFPLKIHGDWYFDQVNDFIKEYEFNGEAPRDENSVKRDCVNEILVPEFEVLHNMKAFKRIQNKLSAL